MNPQLEQSFTRVTDGARASARAALNGARASSRRAASRLQSGKKPLETLQGLGLKLSAVSHRTTDRVLKQQLVLATRQLDLVAERLNLAAAATGLRDFVGTQWKLTPAQLRQLRTDAGESLSIVIDGGREARDVVQSGLANARRKAAAPKARRSKKATGKTAGKKVSKKVSKKASATRHKSARPVVAKAGS